MVGRVGPSYTGVADVDVDVDVAGWLGFHSIVSGLG